VIGHGFSLRPHCCLPPNVVIVGAMHDVIVVRPSPASPPVAEELCWRCLRCCWSLRLAIRCPGSHRKQDCQRKKKRFMEVFLLLAGCTSRHAGVFNLNIDPHP